MTKETWKNHCRVLKAFQHTGMNEVSGTSEFLPLEPPAPVTGAGKSSLGRNHTKLRRLHIFEGRDLGNGLKWP